MQTGDIILTCGNGKFSRLIKFGNLWTRWFKKDKTSKFTHVGVMYDSEMLAEATMGREGVKIETNSYTENYMIARLKDITDGNKSTIQKEIAKYHGEQYSGLLVFFIIVLKLLHLEWLFKGLSYDGTVCSVFVARVYDAIGYRFCDKQALDLIDPQDIAKNIYANPNKWEIIEEKGEE